MIRSAERPRWTNVDFSHRDKSKYFLDRNESRHPGAIKLVKDLLQDTISEFTSEYYDLGLTYSIIQEYLGFAEQNLYITSGADGAIRTFFEYCSFKCHNKNCILMRPSYGMYEVYASNFCQQIQYIDYDKFKDKNTTQFQAIIETLSASPSKSVFILATPESPLGVAYTKDQINLIIKIAIEKNIFVLIDSTYENFAPLNLRHNPDLTAQNIFYAKSLSKSWSLAGVRLGFLIGHHSSIEFAKLTRPMYEIGALQAKLLEKSISRHLDFEKYVLETLEVKQHLLTSLEKIKIDSYDTYANFIHINMLSMTKSQKENLDRIALYKTYSHHSLNTLIRLTIPSRNECDHIISCFS